MDMNMNTTLDGKNVTIAIDGRVDTLTAPVLQQEIESVIGDKDKIILDFKNVTYVSSAGLRVLLFVIKKSDSLNVKLSLSNVSSDIKELFEMTGFIDILNII